MRIMRMALVSVVVLGSACGTASQSVTDVAGASPTVVAGTDAPVAAAGSSTPATRPTTTNRVTRYPALLALRPNATPAGDGPVGRSIAAFVVCGAPTETSESGCSVVLDRADGSQVTVPAPIGDTPLSLSPDGTWLVYLTRDATVVRNLLTGTVHRARPYLKPITWSANNRWLLAGLSYGSDFVVLDTTTGRATVREHPSPPPGATAAPAEPLPTGPFYPCAVTDAGEVVRYPRPDTPSGSGTFVMDVVDPATVAVRRTVTVRLDTPDGDLTPLWQTPALLVLDGRAYLQSAWRGKLALLPVTLSGATAAAGRPLALTGPGPHTGDTNLYGGAVWQSVAAMPGQGLVYRVPGTDGDDLVAIDPATGSSHLLTHTREGWPMALAALPA